jgi:hypothetical protein
MTKNKKTRIFVNRDAKASRFLVELSAPKDEEKNNYRARYAINKIPGIKDNVKEKKDYIFEYIFSKKHTPQPPLDRGGVSQETIDDDYIIEDVTQEQIILNQMEDNHQNGNTESSNIKTRTEEILAHPKTKRLAFYPVFKIFYYLFQIVFSLAYRLGWLVVFVIKFVFILVWRILKAPFSLSLRASAKQSRVISIVPEIPARPGGGATASQTRNGRNKNGLGYERNVAEDNTIQKKLHLNKPKFQFFKKKEKINSLNLLEQLEKEFTEEEKPKRYRQADNSKENSLFANSKTEQKKSEEYSSGQSKEAFPAPIFPLARRRGMMGSLKPAMAFLLILLVITLPLKAITYYQGALGIKASVLGASEEAIEGIKIAKDDIVNKDFQAATAGFNQALSSFQEAKAQIEAFDEVLRIAGKIPQADAQLASLVPSILEAGEISAQLGLELSRQIAIFGRDNYKIKDIYLALSENADFISKKSARLSEILSAINPELLPQEYKEKLLLVQDKAELVLKNISELNEIVAVVGTIFGFKNDQRYLLVFQNNTELRASGGFIGSYAIVDFRDGEIINLEVPEGGSYDTEGGLKDSIIAPEPLWLVNPQWHFWDANWWPDWPTTAEKLNWFLEKSGGPSTDGVISFTPTVLERMLEVIGPIEMIDYGLTIDSENFWEMTQRVVEEDNIILEEKYQASNPKSQTNSKLKIQNSKQEQIVLEEDHLDQSREDSAEALDSRLRGNGSGEIGNEDGEGVLEESKPKKIIGDMMNVILSKTTEEMDKEKAIELFNILFSSLNQKQVLLFFKDKNIQEKISEYGWDGAQKHTKYDYLQVVNSNIAGEKTDRVIRQTIFHNSIVKENGTILNEVIIKREHTGEKQQLFTGVRNVDWIRVYVPQGAELISATGFDEPDAGFFERPEYGWIEDMDLRNEKIAEIDTLSGTKIYVENQKTVFANWSMIDPGETEMIILKYRLPFKINFNKDDSLKKKIIDYLSPGQPELAPYSLLIENQPGQVNSYLESKVTFPEKHSIYWINNYDAGKLLFNQNQYWAYLLKK